MASNAPQPSVPSSPPPSSPPPSSPPQSSPPPSSPPHSSPQPSSPPPSSPPPSSPPPSSPPPSSPPPSSPPPSSPPPSSPPPSSPPPSSPPPSSPPPSSPPPSSPPPSSPPPSSPPPSSPPPANDQKPPPSPSLSPHPPKESGGNNPSPPKDSGSGSTFSPPPPHRRLSPRGMPSPEPDSDSSGNRGSQLNVATIIGIAAGVGILIVVVMVVVIVCTRRKKRSEPPMHYYANKPGDGGYYKHPAAGQNKYGSYRNGEHILNIPPPPGVGRGGQAPPPHGSGDHSNSSYSGQHGPVLPPPHPTVALGFNQSTFTYEELSAATGGFAQQNLLGQGGFGYVHKGVLPNGKEIAVKCLKSTGGQGDREFQAEVDIISRVHHRHLVSLVGYCFSETKKILVYEFVPNQTFEYHLHGKDVPVMDWATRLKIAIGAGKGLAYLHEDCHPRIIHRDIKGANILLENNFEAKVADFGLAKFYQDTNTHVSTRVMGTFGYLAPEYAASGKLTEKSDVFSFGIMLLELITGRRPVSNAEEYGDHDSLADWAKPLCMKAMESGTFDGRGLVDPRLEENYDKQEMARMVACAAAAVRHSAKRRPRMSQIVRVLEGDVSLDILNQGGVKPGQSAVYGGASGEYNAEAYGADLIRFRKLALEGSMTSSEFGGTSDSGQNPSVSSSEQSSGGSNNGRRIGSRVHFR
ncbi:hypothetical protein RJT34_08260 [Clitoria ternatea]|uniref:non-specific serine/threonine protein kinase n=1 Tax=Clitoria ternatea TaxID=43366 RepID=A0AAN9PVK1_CLITE